MLPALVLAKPLTILIDDPESLPSHQSDIPLPDRKCNYLGLDYCGSWAQKEDGESKLQRLVQVFIGKS